MVNGLWGKKIGMTQLFSEENKAVPVTVIDVSDWYVTQIKTTKTDGYNALQLGRVKKKYASEPFSTEWLRKCKTYFSDLREVAYYPEDVKPAEDGEEVAGVKVGQPADEALKLQKGDVVDVFGTSKGHGFQGVVKRHGYSGGPKSHGSTMGRIPGAMSFMTACGRVIKGKALPGHMGVDRVAVKKLEVITVEPEARIVCVKGSVPGKSGSLVFVRKCG